MRIHNQLLGTVLLVLTIVIGAWFIVNSITDPNPDHAALDDATAINGHEQPIVTSIDEGVQDERVVDEPIDFQYLETTDEVQSTRAVSENGPYDIEWEEWGTGVLGFQTEALATGDVDLDGDIDVVSFHREGSGPVVRVSLNLRNGNWQENLSGLPGNGNFTNGLLADIDNDGDLDIIGVTDGNNGRVRVFQNNRTEWWENSGDLAIGPGVIQDYQDVVVGDLDRDGKLDIFRIW